jgi:hypothetical protein
MLKLIIAKWYALLINDHEHQEIIFFWKSGFIKVIKDYVSIGFLVFTKH